jgi:hypothetical protein
VTRLKEGSAVPTNQTSPTAATNTLTPDFVRRVELQYFRVEGALPTWEFAGYEGHFALFCDWHDPRKEKFHVACPFGIGEARAIRLENGWFWVREVLLLT